MLWFLFFGVIVFWFYCNFILKIYIDIPTFIRKGFKAHVGRYGVYCFTGKQGTGKTFSAVQFILRNSKKFPIYSNVHLVGIDYTYFSGFDELLKINDHHCIIVFDEIFTALSKSTRMNTEVLGFLSQMRKREVMFITTAQEWLEINITLRRYVRYQVDCRIYNSLPFSILVEQYHDGENMKWSQEENEYVAPILATRISKMAKKITKHYDTWEVISNKSTPLTPVKAEDTFDELDKTYFDKFTTMLKARLQTVPSEQDYLDAAVPLNVDRTSDNEEATADELSPDRTQTKPPESAQSQLKSSGFALRHYGEWRRARQD